MKQCRLIDRPGMQILNRNDVGGEQRLDVRHGQGRGCHDLGAAGGAPDLDKVALARADGAGKQHGPRRPIGPAIDQ
jgi:hypothetical protein